MFGRVMSSHYARGTNTIVWAWDTPWFNTVTLLRPPGRT